MGSEERHLQVSRGGMADVHEALAWLVSTFDREFAGATMVKLHVEQAMVCGADPDRGGPDGNWVYQWNAVASGCVGEQQHPDPPGGFQPVEPDPG